MCWLCGFYSLLSSVWASRPRHHVIADKHIRQTESVFCLIVITLSIEFSLLSMFPLLPACCCDSKALNRKLSFGEFQFQSSSESDEILCQQLNLRMEK